jgi:serine/threonine protein kinase
MPAPVTTDDFLQLTRQSGIVEAKDLDAYLSTRGDALPASPTEVAKAMVRDGLLTGFQASQFLKGKWRNFIIAGKYKLLEHLGSGGMASVFLCEHVSMHRRVAIKVLPPAQANDPGAVERFYREARAVATLDHPNLVRAHDIDHDGKVHFLVMEYVDGSSLQDIVRKGGPLDVDRATHYIRQAAIGLDAAHAAGLVHRDIKPGNILVDRSGTVKILDMGLARFFRDEGDDITKKFDENCVLGTADYCAPEQALNSHAVDIRVDIYSLGATFYYCLTGDTPFGQGTTAQKIIWHQMKEPTPVREVRPAVPEGLAKVLAKMMAKSADERYQTPAEVEEALAEWDTADVPPPPEEEMPRLCPRSQGPSSDPSTIRRHKSSTTLSARARKPGAPSSDRERTAITPRAGIRPALAQLWAKRKVPVLVGAGAGALLLLLLVAGGVWWALSDGTPAVVSGPGPGNPGRPVNPGNPLPADTGKGSAQPQAVEGVAITTEGNVRHVRTPKYEAVVGDDGSLTNLKVGGVEFFKAGVPFGTQQSRGAYVFHEGGQGVQKLPHIEQSGNTVTARGDLAVLRHTFNPSSINWSVTNLSDADEMLYIVFDKGVRAVTDGRGSWERVPAPVPGNLIRDWPTTSWFADRSRLTLAGGTRIWGQWPSAQENYQVWQLTLRPHETHEAFASVGEATADEMAQVAKATGTAPEVVSPAAAVTAEGVTIKAEKVGRRVLTPKYEALVENDGCVTSLKVGGVELLEPHASFSRGTYFFRQDKNAPLPMPSVEQPAGNVITAKGDLSSARYEFGPDAMTWTLTNGTDKPENFFIVFKTTVTAVTSGGQTVNTPTRQDWATTTWHFGKGRLKITGSNALWGPWPSPQDGCQVWDARLAPRETRKVTLQVLDEPGAPAAPAAPTGMLLQSPRDYQVFQRQARLKGEVVVRGTAPSGCDAVEARLTGKSVDGPLPDRWQPVALTPDRHGFDAPLATTPGGWYRLEVRALRDQKEIAHSAVEHVGLGEVFVIAGQSNSTNCGEERLKPASGLVASFSGDDWRPADDPQPGVQDGSSGGSPWPAFGDALAARCKVPIGIASAGRGGTSVGEWGPGGGLFAALTKRMAALGPHGFRAVLWHQGEADAGMAADDYARLLTETVQASRKAAGWDVPWFVAQVSYRSPGAPTADAPRAGQKKLWETKVALEGPDTDTLTGDNREMDGKGIHLSGKGLRAHGQLWADKVGAYLDKVLAE